MDSLPLARGVVLNNHRFQEPEPHLHIPKAIRDSITSQTIIIAAASPDIKDAHYEKDDFFVSDYCALNYLLKDVGAYQKHLTAVSLRDIITTYPEQDCILFGDASGQRKVVLNHDLLDQHKFTLPEVVEPPAIIARFRELVREAVVAVHNGSAKNLLLIICCHGSQEKGFYLNTKSSVDTLRAQDLKSDLEFLGRPVPTTIFTDSCFSGGWVEKKHKLPGFEPLNVAMFAAPDQHTESLAYKNSASISRSGGTVFLGKFIDNITSKSSPFFEPEESNKQNLREVVNIETFNTFAHEMWSTLNFEDAHDAFHRWTFKANEDQVSKSWQSQTALPMIDYKTLWDELPTVPPSQYSLEGEQDTGSRTTGRHRATGTGPPSPAFQALNQSLGIPYNNDDFAVIATAFSKTCPGDVQKGMGKRTLSQIKSAARGEKNTSLPGCDMEAMIRFRVDACNLADSIVKIFHLRSADGQPCLMWHSFEGSGNLSGSIGYQLYSSLRDKIARQLEFSGELPEPAEFQGPRFLRFRDYIMDCIIDTASHTERVLSVDTMEREATIKTEAAFLTHKITGFLAGLKRPFEGQSCIDLVLEDETLIQKTEKLFKSAGKRFRVPRKARSRIERIRSSPRAKSVSSDKSATHTDPVHRQSIHRKRFSMDLRPRCRTLTSSQGQEPASSQ